MDGSWMQWPCSRGRESTREGLCTRRGEQKEQKDEVIIRLQNLVYAKKERTCAACFSKLLYRPMRWNFLSTNDIVCSLESRI